jgi:gluconolactonase
MKRKLLLSLGVLCAFGIYSCQKDIKNSSGIEESLSAIGAKTAAAGNKRVDTIKTGFSFTEGPAVNKDGNVFFVDHNRSQIWKWDAVTNNITLFLQGSAHSNGMAFDKDGNLITCADSIGQVLKIFPDGTREVLADNYNGKLLNGPNDVWINPVTGGIYITDPLFGRDWWPANDPRKQANYWPGTSMQAQNPLPPGAAWEDIIEGDLGGYVYYLAPGSHTLVRVTTEAMGWSPTKWPNGIVGSPDGKKLYVNKWDFDIEHAGTWSFDINPNGSLSNMKKFADMGGDGMSMDELGNIYISNGLGVVVFDPQGNRVTTIQTGGGVTNNVFAGKNDKVLFITGVDRVMTVQMNIRGVERFK